MSPGRGVEVVMQRRWWLVCHPTQQVCALKSYSDASPCAAPYTCDGGYCRRPPCTDGTCDAGFSCVSGLCVEP